ncbi:hypothetical protein [Minwuia sp.]|uniref:hypothetical protein n=1 Tax=Minwuia sp. TaxID=2493630 RepID=UPI003A94F488
MPHAQNNITNWQYWRCDLDTPADAFGPFAGIVDIWNSKREGAHGLPTRAAFEFTDFKGWWGRVAIAQLHRAPLEVRFSLWGTTLTEWWGTDYTNRRLGEAAHDPDAWLRTEGRYFEAMVAQPFIGIAAGGLDQHDRSFIKVISVDLPVGDAGGPTHVLAFHRQIRLEEAPADTMPDCPMRSLDYLS